MFEAISALIGYSSGEADIVVYILCGCFALFALDTIFGFIISMLGK